jgi:hypothetical protein
VLGILSCGGKTEMCKGWSYLLRRPMHAIAGEEFSAMACSPGGNVIDNEAHFQLKHLRLKFVKD